MKITSDELINLLSSVEQSKGLKQFNEIKSILKTIEERLFNIEQSVQFMAGLNFEDKREIKLK